MLTVNNAREHICPLLWQCSFKRMVNHEEMLSFRCSNFCGKNLRLLLNHAGRNNYNQVCAIMKIGPKLATLQNFS